VRHARHTCSARLDCHSRGPPQRNRRPLWMMRTWRVGCAQIALHPTGCHGSQAATPSQTWWSRASGPLRKQSRDFSTNPSFFSHARARNAATPTRECHPTPTRHPLPPRDKRGIPQSMPSGNPLRKHKSPKAMIPSGVLSLSACTRTTNIEYEGGPEAVEHG
jgi:hypothetical protein